MKVLVYYSINSVQYRLRKCDIINNLMPYKKFTDETSWQVHAGPVLEIPKEGGVYFNGARVRSGSIETDKGAILGMDDLIHFPQLPK